MRLIDTDSAKVEEICCFYGSECRLEDVEEWLNKQPTVEAELVRHGRWIHDINNLYGCSECLGREAMSPKLLKPYCPYCGAKMDGGAKNDQG